MKRPSNLASNRTLDEVLTEAMADFAEHGFDSEDRLLFWELQIRQAIERHLTIRRKLDDSLKRKLQTIYDGMVKRGRVLSNHPGVSRFTLDNLANHLHSELDRRILASSQLIRLNREQSIQKTMQRFSGWATSVPKGGGDIPKGTRAEIAKPLRSLPFVERRVLIDQGHKLTSSISATVAIDGGAIAGKWLSHWKQANYDYREDHKERDGLIYLIRGSWADKKGFVKPGAVGYTDDITQPAEEVSCRCKYTYIYHLRQLPEDMLTEKGKQALKDARAAAA